MTDGIRRRDIGGEKLPPKLLSTKLLPTSPGSPVMSPASRMRYRDFVAMSAITFRSNVEFDEQPRQVVFASILFVMLSISAYWSSASSSLKDTDAFSIGAAMVVVSVTVYAILQTRDGLMVRPHPAVWRAIHGLCLSYYIFLIILMVVPPQAGIKLVHFVFPSITGGPEEALKMANKEGDHDSIISFDHLHCELTILHIWRNLTNIWFITHVIGWWAKMCLFRDWAMCWTYSIAFECLELSLVWMIPEFQECWWDSMFLDVFGANLLGMVLGRYTLYWLECRPYHWETTPRGRPATAIDGLKSRVQWVASRFTPYSWSKYEWPKDPQRWALSSLAWIASMILELNSFFIIHAFVVRPSHWINPVRQLLLAAQGAQAVPEWYEYLRGSVPRIGQNFWLMVTIAILEAMIGVRYGRGGKSYGSMTPPNDILYPVLAWAVLTTAWITVCAWKYKNGQQGVLPLWVRLLRIVSVTPLLFLSRKWAY